MRFPCEWCVVLRYCHSPSTHTKVKTLWINDCLKLVRRVIYRSVFNGQLPVTFHRTSRSGGKEGKMPFTSVDRDEVDIMFWSGLTRGWNSNISVNIPTNSFWVNQHVLNNWWDFKKMFFSVFLILFHFRQKAITVQCAVLWPTSSP